MSTAAACRYRANSPASMGGSFTFRVLKAGKIIGRNSLPVSKPDAFRFILPLNPTLSRTVRSHKKSAGSVSYRASTDEYPTFFC